MARLFKEAKEWAESKDPNDRLFGLAALKQLYQMGERIAKMNPENSEELKAGLANFKRYIESL